MSRSGELIEWNNIDGFFILGIAILAVGLATRTTAVWTIGLVLVGFGLLNARKLKNQ